MFVRANIVKQIVKKDVITSYSIHYTKLYEGFANSSMLQSSGNIPAGKSMFLRFVDYRFKSLAVLSFLFFVAIDHLGSCGDNLLGCVIRHFFFTAKT